MTNKYLIMLVLTVALVAGSTVAFCQPPPAPPPAPPGSVPIDGGVLALLVAGVAFGARKLYNKAQ